MAEPASRFGSPVAVAEPIRANFAHLDRPENAEVADLIEQLRSWSENELAARDDELIVRKRNGFVRECHGDMHLGNMILADETVTIFDCIEFNPDLRWIDVISEVAFCTMDLEDRGRVDLSRRFLNAYLEWSGDYAGLAVFPLYFAYRALVRAKVAQLRREQGGLSDDESERLARTGQLSSTGGEIDRQAGSLSGDHARVVGERQNVRLSGGRRAIGGDSPAFGHRAKTTGRPRAAL